ncbi:CpaE family protein [Phenylobacterium sp.]|uniref:AAA family ATPase n=1 Tax=Phenylobacterium sp. TaxID=1871053 RepID=UPI0035B3474B
MKPQQSHDPFDPDFEAEDDFTSVEGAWRDPPPAAADPFAPEALEEVEPEAFPDPFAELGGARAADRPDPIVIEPAGGHDEDPFGPDGAGAPPPSLAHPVHDMIAGAEAAFGESSLPRITIHIFCVDAETAEMAGQAAADRRMERATVVTRMGGLAAAVEAYRNEATPSLVMVESADPAAQLLGLLDKLAEVCDPGTKVVVIGQANDIALYRELMRRGVSEYIVPPLNPLLLVRTAASLYADPSAPFVGRQIAFCGAKGGAGASTIAHNIAYSITERLLTGAVLVDLDLPFGTAGLDFNQDPIQGVVDALSQPDRLDPVLMDRMMVRCTDRLSLFAAPATLEADYDISTEAFEEVTQKIRSAAPFVVLDLPHAWTPWKRKILLSSDDLVIVATPDLASLRNAKNMIDLVRRARPNDAPPRLVLNQVGVPGRPEIPVKDFGEALGLTPALCLPFDPKLFGQAANNGQMIAEVGPKSRSAEGLDHLAQQIARREPPQVQKASLLSSLFKKK